MTWQDEDRHLVIAAATELDDYLDSSQLTWRLAGSAGMLTPGNLLLSLSRKNQNGSILSALEFNTAEIKIINTLEKRRAMWDRKIGEEIPYRIRLWQNSIEEYVDEEFLDHTYSAQVRNRVIIELLLNEARIVKPQSRKDIEITDESLKRISKEGSFVWEQPLADIYTKEKYWFLYLQIG